MSDNTKAATNTTQANKEFVGLGFNFGTATQTSDLTQSPIIDDGSKNSNGANTTTVSVSASNLGDIFGSEKSNTDPHKTQYSGPTNQYAIPTPQTPPPQIQIPQTPPPQIQISQTPPPQIQIPQTPPPQIQISQTPPPQIQIPQTPPPQIQIPQTPPPQIQVSQTPPPQIQIPQTPPPQIQIPQTPPPQIQIPQTPPPQIQIPQTPPPIIVKKGSKISPAGFAIGCGFLGLFIVGAIGALLYFAIQNPDQFKGILAIEDIKTGLKLFVGLFFGILFFAGFGMGIFNLYKLITTKTGSKIGYIIGLVVSGILLIGSAVGGTIVFNKINEIIGTTGANSSLIVPQIEFKDGMKPISDGFPILAPTSVYYAVNQDLLNRFIATEFTKSKLTSLTLLCGNEVEQALPYNSEQKSFIGGCLYTKKGVFDIKMLIKSIDLTTNTEQIEVRDIFPLFIISEITLTPSQGSLQFNDAKDEIIIGKAPTKLSINSSKIFEDLKLSTYSIKRDLDNDGIFDSENDTSVVHQFREPKLQTISYMLPDVTGYEKLVYTINFRVQQNEVPICTLSASPGSKTTQYSIEATFDDINASITSYLYKAKDLSTQKYTTLPSNGSSSLDYEFPKKGSYVIELEYATDEGKHGYCETDTINVGTSVFTPRYNINYKNSDDTNRNSAAGSGVVSFKDGSLFVGSLPMRVQLMINDISPQTAKTIVEVKHNNKSILSSDKKSYEFTITNVDKQEISIDINDPILGASSTITIPIVVAQDEIVGQVKAFPDSVGISPFKVTLDASTITLTDKGDEIIYFSRDFGDGEKNPNMSQGRITHTYSYNEKNQQGTYEPKVTITTKKGKKSTITLNNPILVKKPNIDAKISIDSHPAQIAKVGDQVSFTIQTDGNPTNIAWDFANENPIECSDRSCATVPTFFSEKGRYEINAVIHYADLTKTTATTTLIVE